MLLDDVARTSADLGRTPGRTAKIDRLAACLKGLRPAEVPVAVAYLSGALPQGTIGVGWASLRDLPPPAARPTARAAGRRRALARVGAATGPGCQAARRRELSPTCSAGRPSPSAGSSAPAPRRPAPGRARGADGRGRRPGRRPAGRRRAARADAGRRARARGRRRARRRAPPACRASALDRPATGAADARADGRRRRGRPRPDRPRRGRVEARRRADPGAPARATTSACSPATSPTSPSGCPEIVEAVRALPASALILDGEAIALRPRRRGRFRSR